MIVVSDTSPLSYLVEIGAVELLPALFGRVVLPSMVMAELRHARTPAVVRAWIAHPPEWLDVRAPATIDTELRLDPGEAEAISLARELKADLLLIDERDGTRVARTLGLATTGTLGVLDVGAELGLVSLPEALLRLESTKFRRSQTLFDALLAKDRARGRARGR